MNSMRILDLIGDAPKRQRGALTIACAVVGCPRPSSSQKGYCLEHLSELPYPAALAVEEARREVEIEDAARGRWRRLDPAGSRCRQILALLESHGARSVGGLTHELDVAYARHGSPAVSIVYMFCRALEAAGRVTLAESKNRRGQARWFVRLA